MENPGQFRVEINRLNVKCFNGADRRGIADRFVQVIQGWHPEHYLRCLKRTAFALDLPLVGVGSMCRRHVDGEYGIHNVLDVLDRAFDGSETRFHLFGLKSQGMLAAHSHPRVASCDSQAYGVAARQKALKLRCGRPDTLVAGVMERWIEQQYTWASKDFSSRSPAQWQPRTSRPAASLLEARVAASMEHLRTLHEAGELEWPQVSPLTALQMAFMDDEPDDVGDTTPG